MRNKDIQNRNNISSNFKNGRVHNEVINVTDQQDQPTNSNEHTDGDDNNDINNYSCYIVGDSMTQYLNPHKMNRQSNTRIFIRSFSRYHNEVYI